MISCPDVNFYNSNLEAAKWYSQRQPIKILFVNHAQFIKEISPIFAQNSALFENKCE